MIRSRPLTSQPTRQVTVGTHVVVAGEGTELPSGDVVSKVTLSKCLVPSDI
jgi:hypothetical protein